MVDEFLVPYSSYFRLLNEYEKYGSLVIGYDFDGTVYDYHKKGYKYPLMEQLLRDLKKANCKLICWTSNPDIEFVRNYLAENDIPFDGINENAIDLGWKSDKLFFSALLDDRAGLLQVYNDLKKLLKTIQK